MKYCIYCGEPLSDSAIFCSKCGKKQVKNDKKSQSNNEERHTSQSSMTKCPNCGEIIDSFKTNCPSCGYELRNTQSSESVRSFFDKVENIENNNSNKRFKFIDGISKSFGLGSSDDKLITLIQSYSIPNNKEDVLEFFILASSNAVPFSHESSNKKAAAKSDAWLSKLEQAKMKADIMFNHDESEYLQICQIYKKVHDEIRFSKLKVHADWIIPLLLFALIYIIVGLLENPMKTLLILGILLGIIVVCLLVFMLFYKVFKKVK